MIAGETLLGRSVVRLGAGIAAVRGRGELFRAKKPVQRLRSVQASVSTCLPQSRGKAGASGPNKFTGGLRGYAGPCWVAAAPSRGSSLTRSRTAVARTSRHFFGSRAMGMQKNCKKERCVQARGAKYWGLDLRCITSLKCGFSRSSSITHVLHMNSLPSTVNVEKSVPEFLKSCEISPCKMQWKT